RGKGWRTKFIFPFRLIKSVWQALKILRRFRPDVVLAMGGFVSGPAGIAAKLLRIPLVVHEQNSVAGLTNRLLARLAHKTLQAFPDSFAKKIKAETVANPTRIKLHLSDPAQRLQAHTGALRILVLGGSQGAQALNNAVRALCYEFTNELNADFWLQTGAKNYAQAKIEFSGLASRIKLSAFIEDMAEAYAWADVVICRSGALTIAEITAAGIASILVPFPYAVDNHQYYNARHLVDADAAILIPQAQLTPKVLADILMDLEQNHHRLIEMAVNAKRLAKPNSTELVIAACRACCEGSADQASTGQSILSSSAIKKIHLLGIGGIGVSGLAEILLMKGYQVSGTDMQSSLITQRLEKLGATIYHVHDAKHVANIDAAVYSSAIDHDNVELYEIKKLNIPCLQRGELLAELMHGFQNSVAVSGTHGKTTTTGLLAHILPAADKDCTYVMGGILQGNDSTVGAATSDIFVAEADESDASFLYLKPRYAIITNIDADHMATYQHDESQLQDAFIKFLNQLPVDGAAILCIDDPGIKTILPKLKCHTLTYGFDAAAEFRISEFSQQGLISQFTLNFKTQKLTLKLNLPGAHNVSNAVAALALVQLIKGNVDQAATVLAKFPGVGRRFSYHGQLALGDGEAMLFDDYGHHPREILATFTAAREAWPTRRVVLVFQPHRYSRTRDLMPEFINVLSEVSSLVLLDVYSAGETPIENASGQALYQALCRQSAHKPTFISSLEVLKTELPRLLRADDIVIFQGAGSIGPFAKTFLAEFKGL
ncbi:MAG: UDP-N-acetylmuramate--L-alanine ligase, partial [Gammaproteobacteria bacterium]|nr:UDP-N-acetylmuramate--L-alanine ligase [Gammaproteobacteria bacterium]